MTDERARIVILEGPCGAGKSTLLRALRRPLPHGDPAPELVLARFLDLIHARR